MSNGKFAFWYNYQTNKFEALQGCPSTDEQAVMYIPQISSAQSLYFLLRRDKGESILGALAYALERMCNSGGDKQL